MAASDLDACTEYAAHHHEVLSALMTVKFAPVSGKTKSQLILVKGTTS